MAGLGKTKDKVSTLSSKETNATENKPRSTRKRKKGTDISHSAIYVCT